MSTVWPSSNKNTPTSFKDLPAETTTEIFARLPVKDLIKSTSVNKTWYSLINNPSFISSQITRSLSNCHDNALLIIPPITSHQNYCSLISADTSSLIEKFDIPFETRSRSLKLITEVHGMLLLTDLHMHYASRDLYLWNPYVKRHRVLVSSCFRKVLDNREKTYYVVGMGYDKTTDDYKVVRVVYVQDGFGRQFGDVEPKVEVYSFRKNTWRKLKDVGVPRLAIEDGAYVNGIYYWLELKQPCTPEARTCYGNKLMMLCFDFDKEVFGDFKVPNDVFDSLGRLTPFRLMDFQGSLALCVLEVQRCNKEKSRYPYGIWLLRKENNSVSWSLCNKVVLKKGGPPLNVTKNGTLVIESFGPERFDVSSIVSCNLKTMILVDHGFGKHGGPEVSQFVMAPATVDTSFPESLIMYEGGKYLSKFSK
ncbi:F-box/kelch-repeat protein At3g23880-like [Apium graveolens]|uniref:F-box/kelch-repeat protein At3g23880-like n=1 Tax=Apium graveolens TaxID=4045 RepID=UPI003D7BDCC8